MLQMNAGNTTLWPYEYCAVWNIYIHLDLLKAIFKRIIKLLVILKMNFKCKFDEGKGNVNVKTTGMYPVLTNTYE